MTCTTWLGRAGALLGCGVVILVRTGSAAEIAVGRERGMSGQTHVSVPVTLTPGAGEKVGGVQFELTFDATRLSLNTVSTGPTAERASKDVYFTTLAPGNVRVIVAGLNQNAIDGGVLARAFFDITATAPDGETPVSLSGLVLSDPVGTGIPVKAIFGAVMIGANVAFADATATEPSRVPVAPVRWYTRSFFVPVIIVGVVVLLVLGHRFASPPRKR